MAVVGVVSDRIGRRPVLIAVGLLGALGALALAASTDVVVVVVASGLGGIGRGGGAGSGSAFSPFFPAELPLLVAAVPTALHGTGMSWIDAYEVVFLVGAGASLLVAGASVPLREHRLRRVSRGAAASGTATTTSSNPAGLTTRQLTGRLGITNALNGFGFGFLGPLLTYWFHVRFGAGPAEVGVLYTVVNLVSALPFLGAHRLTRRLGAVRTVVVTRGASVLMLLFMAFMPDFLLAALLRNLRTICTSLGLPARQSYAMGAADDRRRGTVAALSTHALHAHSSVSPAVGGGPHGRVRRRPGARCRRLHGHQHRHLLPGLPPRPSAWGNVWRGAPPMTSDRRCVRLIECTRRLSSPAGSTSSRSGRPSPGPRCSVVTVEHLGTVPMGASGGLRCRSSAPGSQALDHRARTGHRLARRRPLSVSIAV